MWGRRIAYLLTLLGSLVFYGFYKEWLSWIAMMAILFLPVLSLLISLPAMLTVKAALRCPKTVRMGVPARTALHYDCMFPIPPVKSRIRLRHSLTEQSFQLRVIGKLSGGAPFVVLAIRLGSEG